MCRLFGYIGEKRHLAGYLGGNKNSLLKQSHGTISNKGNSMTKHRDGWGIYWKKGPDQFYERRGREEFEDNNFLSASLEIKAELSIAHIRYATKGTPVTRKESQPLIDDDIILAHNGTLYPYIDEGKVKNLTDSQVILERLKKNWSGRDYKSLVVCLYNIIIEVGENYTAMNLLISNEKEIFAFCKFKEIDKYVANYYTMWLKSKPRYTIVSSQQIDEDCFGWEKMENSSLVHITKEGIIGKTFLTKQAF
ncbi:class II glutamine amidotransferase [Candidatus Dependentiae bacterium]|nr:class II glutamine amidotransferase [Candidatus Dependentiae bacterium]